MTSPFATPGRGRLLVRRARLVPLDGEAAGSAVDLRIADGVIVEVGAGLAGAAGEDELEASGRWVLPGLWDAHVHATQAARAASWLDVSAAGSAADVVEAVRGWVASPVPVGQALVGFGYRSAAWTVPASVADLDAVSDGRPVVLIAGDAHNGWLNSPAQALLGTGPFAGAVFEDEWFELFASLDRLPGFDGGDVAMRAWLAGAAARGITGIVDFEFSDAPRDWAARVGRGLALCRVRAGVYPGQLAEVGALGLRSGDPLEPSGLARMGPVKVISDGSLGSGTAWCCEPYAGGHGHGAPNLPVAELVELSRTARAAGLEVAIHGIGDRACQAALDAFEATGAAGTVEHAQLLRREDLPRFARLGVAASVQPQHLVDDRDLADASWGSAARRAYAFRSLLDAGAELRLGSDAPIAPVDPWGAMAAAVLRSGDARPGWHPEESLTVVEALRASFDGRRLAVGQPGDVVVLGDDPLGGEGARTPSLRSADRGRQADERARQEADRLRAMPVLATVCAGRVTWSAT